MATYTDIDATSIDAVATYTDLACTDLVETIAVSKVATGTYEGDVAFDYGLYVPGVTYYLKVTYTPPAEAQRSQIVPILVLPVSGASATATTTGTDSSGQHVQPPFLRLRLGLGSFRDTDMTNAKDPVRRDRYESEWEVPDENRGKIIHFLVYSTRAGEPWAMPSLGIEYSGEGRFRAN